MKKISKTNNCKGKMGSGTFFRKSVTDNVCLIPQGSQGHWFEAGMSRLKPCLSQKRCQGQFRIFLRCARNLPRQADISSEKVSGTISTFLEAGMSRLSHIRKIRKVSGTISSIRHVPGNECPRPRSRRSLNPREPRLQGVATLRSPH